MSRNEDIQKWREKLFFETFISAQKIDAKDIDYSPQRVGGCVDCRSELRSRLVFMQVGGIYLKVENIKIRNKHK